MGVDIYGRAPRSKAGRYFAANWGAWGDLAQVCLRVAPGPCSQIDEKYWFCNDGYGLDDAGAIALADALDHAIETDALLKHEDELSGRETEDDPRLRNCLLKDDRLDGRDGIEFRKQPGTKRAGFQGVRLRPPEEPPIDPYSTDERPNR